MSKKSISTYIGLGILCLCAIIFIFPYYAMIIGSIKNNSAFMKVPPDLLPINLTAANYIYLISQPVLKWFANSVISSVSVTGITLLFAAAAAYSLAKKQFKGRKIIFSIIVFTLVIPRQVFMIPLFITVKNMGLYDTLYAIIFPCIATPFSVFLLRQFMMTLPSELVEAAKIDGSTEIGTFMKIIIPLSKPAMGALAIFTFVNVWNDYFWQLLVLSSSVKKTVPLGIANMVQERVQNYGYQMAGAATASIPMLIVYLIFQRNFIGGITMGSVKG